MADYKLRFSDGSDATVSVRIADELAWERRERSEPGGVLERMLFMLHRASGSPLPLDQWVETLDDWDRVEVEADPTDPPPSTTPASPTT